MVSDQECIKVTIIIPIGIPVMFNNTA